MNIVADENVDQAIVRGLRAHGHDVWYVAEQAAGIDDESVLRRSRESGALLVTAEKDFGEIVFRQGCATAGVLLLRLAGMPSLDRAQLTQRVLDHHGSELIGAFSMPTADALRIRRSARS